MAELLRFWLVGLVVAVIALPQIGLYLYTLRHKVTVPESEAVEP